MNLVNEKTRLVGLGESYLERSFNVGFSGGERKRNEILQMALLTPKLAILDEIDSGLDIDALQTVSEAINTLRNENMSIILITHYQRILQYMKPDAVHILYKGKVVKSGGWELATSLEQKGYEEVIQPNSTSQMGVI